MYINNSIATSKPSLSSCIKQKLNLLHFLEEHSSSYLHISPYGLPQ